MILIVCSSCSFALRVLPELAFSGGVELHQLVGTASQFWPNRFVCPRCGRPANGLLESEADPATLANIQVLDLTPQEAFSAFSGAGLPEEQRCSLDFVQALLKETPIRKVVGRNIVGKERTLIDALELWDGSKVFFGAGSDGAVIYKITRPGSYTSATLREIPIGR